jgi:hypothetical protein
MKVEGHVPEMAGRAGGSAKHHAVDQSGSANPGAERQHDYVALGTGRAPEDFGNQCGARVIVGVEGKVTGGNYVGQELSFEEVQVSGQAVHARSSGVDHSFAADADSAQGGRGALQDGVNKIVQCGWSARRGFTETFDEVTAQVYYGSFDGGGANVDADRKRDLGGSAWPVLAHNRCALYALYAILVSPAIPGRGVKCRKER